MRVSVKYMAQLRQAAGIGGETVELDGSATVRDLVHSLAVRHDHAFARFLFGENGTIQPSLLVFVGEEQVRPDSQIVLGDGDTVTLLTPMAGG
jgi:molybdopterin converting factor small subunit